MAAIVREHFKALHPVGNWCRPLPEKSRVVPLKFGRLDVPDAVDNRAYCTAIEDQGALPHCAAYTAAAFAENVIWRRDGRIRQVETEPLYKWAKQHDGEPDGDGTTLEAVLKALLARGIFDPKLCRIRKVGSALVGTDIEDVKATVHRFGCFLAGFRITEEWYDYSGRQGNISGRTVKPIGGHAVLVCGYNPNGVWIENSWGQKWAYNGFGFIEWAAFKKQFMYGTVLTHCLDGFK